MVFAGFWVRLAAFIIDQAIVGMALMFVRLSLNIIRLLFGAPALTGRLLFSFSLRDIVLYCCGVLYFIICTYYAGTTPGKRLMNLRVISADGNEHIPFINVLYRETVGRFLSGFLLSIGYLLIALDRDKRGLHDILCDTRVIYARKIRLYPKYPNPMPYQPVPPYHPIQPYDPGAPLPPHGPEGPKSADDNDTPENYTNNQI